MKTIATIFRKELKDSLRDRRTIITMIVVPLLLFPILINISSRMMLSQVRKAQQRILRVGLLTYGGAEDFRQMILQREDLEAREDLDEEQGQALVREDALDAFIVFDRDFDRQVDDLKQGSIKLYMKVTEDSEIEKDRVMKLLTDFEADLRVKRFQKLDLDESIIKTISVSELNLATPKERLAQVIGGFLPYLFIIFCFMGSMYPAIDLAAGEKERGTLETLLTAPVGRFQILVGKFGVVMLTGITSAAVSMLGMYIGIRRVREVPTELLDTILSILEIDSILLLLSLLLPLTIFFAALLLSLSIFARSFKEAQSVISPMMIVVIIPAFIGLMPGMALTPTTALIPILNVSLATKAIIAGTISISNLIVVYLSLIVFAGISILFCSRVFGRESAIFR